MDNKTIKRAEVHKGLLRSRPRQECQDIVGAVLKEAGFDLTAKYSRHVDELRDVIVFTQEVRPEVATG